jgi:hypothetical protein
MSMMCVMKGCTEKKGLCIHEKAMLFVVVLVGLAAMGLLVY